MSSSLTQEPGTEADPNLMLLRFQGIQEQVEKEELIFNLKASKYRKFNTFIHR